jgi:hypothetical protein
MTRQEANVLVQEIVKLRNEKQFFEADLLRKQLVVDNWLVSYNKDGSVFLLDRTFTGR